MAATIGTLVFEKLPAIDVPAPTHEQIRSALVARPGSWAVVARADRLDRAQSIADRINAGSTYGRGFEAAARSLGSRADARVYARYSEQS